MNLGKIRYLLEQQKVTIKQFTNEIGITQQALHKMITLNSTKQSTLEKIAKYFNVPINYFYETEMTGKDNEKQRLTKELEQAQEKIKLLQEQIKDKNELLKIIKDTEFINVGMSLKLLTALLYNDKEKQVVKLIKNNIEVKLRIEDYLKDKSTIKLIESGFITDKDFLEFYYELTKAKDKSTKNKRG